MREQVLVAQSKAQVCCRDGAQDGLHLFHREGVEATTIVLAHVWRLMGSWRS
jgi:hypothetical protein